ncbi:hypothetical protein [Streptomyces yerevanensis]|uniref:hypothetical protein n=1 Tax=Streptomyces yerevanensis TaxID=66378 RepID=UPI000525BA31|nr:hypothetical protein [Streptomyces yerevanensis]
MVCFQALLEAMIAEAGAWELVDVNRVSVDSTVACAHQDVAGMVVDPELLEGLEELAWRLPGHPRRRRCSAVPSLISRYRLEAC